MPSSSKPSLAVGVAFDDAYLLPGLVALVSAAKAMRSESIDLVVMADVQASSHEFITQVEERHRLRIRKVRPSEKTVPLSHLPHLSPMTNARLDLEAWQLNTDRFLYLDSDTLMAQRPDLPSRLPDGIAVAGAVDAVIPTHGDLARLRGDLNARSLFSENSREAYFNAGVLLVDVAEWERQGVGEACIELISAFPQLSDQDALNLVVAGKKGILAPRLNVQTAQRAWRSGRPLKGNSIQAGPHGSQVQVIHFTADKPWKSPRPRPSHIQWLNFLVGQLPQRSDNLRWLAQSLRSRRV